jgi:Secretion system C-terminal sorting domain
MGKLKNVFIICIVIPISYIYTYSQSDSCYYPMSLNNEWEFNTHTEIIIDTIWRNGNLYYGFSHYTSEPDYWMREANNKVYYFDPHDYREFLLYDFTIDIGDSILFPSGFNILGLPTKCFYGDQIVLVSKNETIITPSDTFSNCYHFKHKAYCFDSGIYDSWFAPDIGKIKYVEDMTGSAWEHLLENHKLVTSVKDKSNNVRVTSFELSQNYPNPFNPVTTIKYQIPAQGRNDNLQVVLKVYDILGSEVAILVNQIKQSGNYEVKFDASNLSSGVYLYKIISGNYLETKKMVLLK